jgi:DNA polymerase I-like protein with 3'-5' exonuclease and polymerase domains
MPTIATHELRPEARSALDDQIYNGLDACVTLEVWEELQTLLGDPGHPAHLAYRFERALQGPALDMMLRGFRVDMYERDKAIAALRQKVATYQGVLQRLAHAVWDKQLNPRSPAQLRDFFYTKMRLPEVVRHVRGERKLPMDRETLEKLEIYLYARPIVTCILEIRDASKMLETLETQVDADQRLRTSYNISGTETWRWSSSKSSTGSGGNLMNLKVDDDIDDPETTTVRRIFEADPGWKLIHIDLDQAEAREVGWTFWTLFGSPTYLDACEKGDLHTTTARLVWPNLGWTGQPAADRKIADRLYYRHFSYRQTSKRGGFLTNYMGTAWTASRKLKVPLKLMENFQDAYIGQAYPDFPKWWRWVAEQLETRHELTNNFGCRRHFFGRPRDDATLREAIAFGPQSSTAQRLELGLWRIWHHMGTRVQMLAQVYDSLTFQVRESDDHAGVIAEALGHLRVPLEHAGRVFDVPGSVKVGWNWGTWDPVQNSNGLRKWTGADTRTRRTGLDRVL